MKTGLIVFIMLFSSFSCFYIPTAAGIDYPTKPIELIVGMEPGAGADLGARLIGEHAKKYLGQEVAVDNKPGGHATVAITLISKAKPDGYKLGATSDVPLTLSPFLQKVIYEPENLTYICQYGVLDIGTVVRADSPFRSMKDVIEFARTNPDKLTVATMGPRSFTSLMWEVLIKDEGLKVKLVPFAGAPAAMAALLGGHVMVTSTSMSGFAQHLRAKKVRLLGVASSERIDDYPEVPTFKEAVNPLFVFQTLYIITGPGNIERAIVSKLEEAFRKAMEAPEFIKGTKDLTIYPPKPLFGDRLKENIFQKIQFCKDLLKKLGIEPKK
jgi:tripartite-type tricarboxylate transporter receptor subunit TctC